jgi:hypothetical protein
MLYLDELELEKDGQYAIMDIESGDDGNARESLIPYRREENERIVGISGRALGQSTDELRTLVKLVDTLYRTRKMSIFGSGTQHNASVTGCVE